MFNFNLKGGVSRYRSTSLGSYKSMRLSYLWDIDSGQKGSHITCGEDDRASLLASSGIEGVSVAER